MLLLMSGAGKDCRDRPKQGPEACSARSASINPKIKLIIEKCHNLLLFQQLEQTGPGLFRT